MQPPAPGLLQFRQPQRQQQHGHELHFGGEYIAGDSASRPAISHSPCIRSQQSILYRPLLPCDLVPLKELHGRLFPIDYDNTFFQKAVHGHDRVFSCAAVGVQPGEQQQLLGFVTARWVRLCECDTTDRHYMGFAERWLDQDLALYVLTLGVVETHRQHGIAAQMLAAVRNYACSIRARAVFLHVISYNTAAIRLYSRLQYQCMAQLFSFYHIESGRQPQPSQQDYDAFLYVLHLPGMHSEAGSGAPWDALMCAAAPLRTAFVRFTECMPWYQRPRYSGYGPSDHPSPIESPPHTMHRPPSTAVQPQAYSFGSQHGAPTLLQRFFMPMHGQEH